MSGVVRGLLLLLWEGKRRGVGKGGGKEGREKEREVGIYIGSWKIAFGYRVCVIGGGGFWRVGDGGMMGGRGCSSIATSLSFSRIRGNSS